MSSAHDELIRSLFLQAIELPSDAERNRFLDSACSDSAVRKEVESLLEHHRTETLLSQKDTDKGAAGVTRVRRAIRPSKPTPPPTIPLTELSPNRFWHRPQFTILFLGLVLIASLLVCVTWIQGRIHHHMRTRVEQDLTVTLSTRCAAITAWIEAERETFNGWARSKAIRSTITDLITDAELKGYEHASLEKSPHQAKLAEELARLSHNRTTMRFAVWDRVGRLIADSTVVPGTLGNGVTEVGAVMLTRVFGGETVLWTPSRNEYITSGWKPPTLPSGESLRPGVVLIVPVEDDNGEKIAALMIGGMGLQERLEEIVHGQWYGESIETYMFDVDGYMATESRFADQLHELGLVNNPTDTGTAHAMRLGDPGGNLLAGYKPTMPQVEWPLNRMAASGVTGRSGSDFDGYRDYRGVPVVGAWRWLESCRMGVAVEEDYDTAFAADRQMSLFVKGQLAMAVFLICVALALASFHARKAAKLSERTLGPYQILDLLGEGGLARVHLARHVLLQRLTALKVLKADRMATENMNRLAREVKLASSLTHPNTVQIWDFGYDKTGHFYCAMEYIPGLTLAELVRKHGPIPCERVVYLLRQICGSLREAHALGIVHRDIKPQNIMICERGGEFDVVKVLDFGLAKEFDTPDRALTRTQNLVGTPQYIAPERILNPQCLDIRSDVYSVGVVAYNLLTGRDLFDFQNPMEALKFALSFQPQSFADLVPGGLPEALDELIQDCLQEKPGKRPQSMSEFMTRLDQIPFFTPWCNSLATQWWLANEAELSRSSELIDA